MRYFQITVTDAEQASEHPSASERPVARPEGSPGARMPNRLYGDRAAYQSVEPPITEVSDLRLKRNIRPI